MAVCVCLCVFEYAADAGMVHSNECTYCHVSPSCSCSILSLLVSTLERWNVVILGMTL